MTLKQEIKEFLQGVIDNEDHKSTWFFDLVTHNGKRWALVAAWMDYDDEDDWKPYAKLAYQPTNSLMQEYDIDWMMPFDEKNSCCDDTECPVDEDTLDADIDWWLEQWERFKEEYVYKEDEDNE